MPCADPKDSALELQIASTEAASTEQQLRPQKRFRFRSKRSASSPTALPPAAPSKVDGASLTAVSVDSSVSKVQGTTPDEAREKRALAEENVTDDKARRVRLR